MSTARWAVAIAALTPCGALELTPIKLDGAWTARAKFYAELQSCRHEQRTDFFAPGATFQDLMGDEPEGAQAVVDALNCHPSLISLSLPASWPKLELVPLSTSRGKYGKRLVVEWQALVGGREIPLGRGMSMVEVDPESGRIIRGAEVAELPWRAFGKAALALARLFPGPEDGCRTDMISEMPPSVVDPEWMSEVIQTVRPGSLVDTTGDGRVDAMLVDTEGDGRADRVVSLIGQPTWLADGVSANDLAATAGAASIMGFYNAFNERDLDALMEHITDDCVYEDLMLGTLTTYSGKQSICDALGYHPAFATEQLSGQGPFGQLPSFTLNVVNMVESDDILGVEWQCLADGEPLAFGGRGLSQVHICQNSYKIKKVTDFCEALWRVLGLLSRPLLTPLLATSRLQAQLMNVEPSDVEASEEDALITKGQAPVVRIDAGWAIDTTGDGLVDSRLVDTNGDGCGNDLVALDVVAGSQIDIDGDGIDDVRAKAAPDGSLTMELLEEPSPRFVRTRDNDDVDGDDR